MRGVRQGGHEAGSGQEPAGTGICDHRPMSATQKFDTRLVGWLSLAQLISWGSVFYAFALLLEPVERELGLTRAQTSLAFSLALLAEGLLAYPVGRWIERGHERMVMTAGSVLLGLCLLLHSRIQDMTDFYLVWLGLGVGLAGTLYPPAFAVVTRRYPNDFRRAIITMTFLGGLASTVFIPLTDWLIDLLGWRQALLPLAAVNLLFCAPLHALVLKNAPTGQGLAGAHAHGPTGARLRTLMFSPPFLLTGAFIVLMMATTAALPAHLVSLLREQGLPEAWVIIVPAAVGVLQVFGRALIYLCEYRINLHLLNRLTPGLIPLGVLSLLLAPLTGAAQIGLVWLFVLLYGMGNGMLTIVKGTAVAEYVSKEQMASLNGVLGLPQALARAAAPFLLGLLWSPQSGYAAGLWVLLGISVLGVSALTLAQQIASARQ